MSKFLILDRDGTINRDTNYTYKVKELEILPGAVEGLKKFRNAGFRFIIITNQAGIAKSIFTQTDLDIFQAELLKQLANHGIQIERIYHCPHHPDINGKCACRKPGTKLVTLAEKEFNFKAVNAVVIGDKDSDIELGKNCGALTILIENNQYPNLQQPNFRAKNLDHAFELLQPIK